MVFTKSQNINFNWSYENTISGKWGFSINIPLPPPVSFMSINFGFDAYYFVDIKLGAHGVVPNIQMYYLTVFADVGSAVNVDASAALRVLIVEGGVFIGGTLVSVRTNPKLMFAYNYAQKKVSVIVDWKFYLRAFSFKWGFFVRYFSWTGWSNKIIIKEWPISNGIEKTFVVLYLQQTYNL